MSQCERLKKWLLEHGEIDTAIASRELGIGRLAARVYDLRNRGMAIVTYTKHVKNRFGETCKVALYRLENTTKTHTEARDGDFEANSIPMVRVGAESRQEALN